MQRFQHESIGANPIQAKLSGVFKAELLVSLPQASIIEWRQRESPAVLSGLGGKSSSSANGF